jgi:hypothetical protein
MHTIPKAMKSLEIRLEDEKSEDHAQTLLQHIQTGDGHLPPEVCKAIEELWKDGGVRKAFERSNEYHLPDNTA